MHFWSQMPNSSIVLPEDKDNMGNLIKPSWNHVRCKSAFGEDVSRHRPAASDSKSVIMATVKCTI